LNVLGGWFHFFGFCPYLFLWFVEYFFVIARHKALNILHFWLEINLFSNSLGLFRRFALRNDRKDTLYVKLCLILKIKK
jgi:hypothetical protein